MDVGFAISSLPTKETYWCVKYITLDIAIPTPYLDYLSYGVNEMTNKELCRKLRSALTYKDLGLCPKAADLIEQLVATCEQLKEKNKDLLVLAIEEHARAEGLNYALSQCQPEIGTAYEKVAEAAETGLRRDLAKVFHEAFTHKYGNQPFNNDELK